MKEHKSYLGKLNGISVVYCDKIPQGMEVAQENTFYTPDEDMVFAKDGELFDSVYIHDASVKIEDYVEIKDPRPQPEEFE